MQDLKDKVALVTGGTRGIGRDIALYLAGLGARVALTGTRQEDATRVASELRESTGSAVEGYGLDVVDEEQVERVFEAVTARFGRLDVLINNAGIVRDNLVLRMSSEDWDRVLAVNLRGVFLCARRALKTMMRQRSGSIVNMSSVVGLYGNAGQANYAASKAGIIGFTRSIAREYASKGIRANVVAPGFIATDMTRGLPEAKLKEFVGRIPLARFGSVRDVAHAVGFLASELSSYITGQVLGVDGGLVI
jgi:3-oxoacyl-[acyl-carrier protein] reductase